MGSLLINRFMNIQDQIIEQILTTRNYTMYNGWENARTDYGYHSFNLPGIEIKAQRTPSMRIEEFKKHISFDNKVVVDIGCNVGGMLFHLPSIKKGYGFDYDEKCISAAKNISKILERDNLEFNTIDLDKVAHNTLDNYFQEKVDVVFLLSINKWIKSHKDLYRYFIESGADIIIELNNNRKDQKQLNVFREYGLEPELIIQGSPDDNTPENKNHRCTYIVRNAKSRSS